MNFEKYSLFYFLALISEIIGTVSGFGSSILFVPLAALFFDFKLVLGITAVFHVFSNIAKIVLFRQGFDKNIVLKLGTSAVVSVIIGAMLTTLVPLQQTELAMNFLLVLLAIYLLFYSDKKLEANDKNLWIGGSLSGFLAGLIGTGGAIRGLVLTSFGLEKNIFVATSAMIDFGVDFSRAVVYIWNDYFPFDLITMIPFLIVVSWLGSWIGKKILAYTSQHVFRYVVLGAIILTTSLQIIKQFLD
jgi:uncharacterized membrane protein YfcA